MQKDTAGQKTKTEFTLAEIAQLTQTKLVGDPNIRITGVADLESAGQEDISFLANLRYQQAMQSSKAAAIIIDASIALEPGRNFLISDHPSRTFQQLIEAFYGPSHREITGFTGIHPTAVIHPSAKLGSDVTVGPHAVVDKDAQIGDRTIVSAGCFVGLGVIIGVDCLLHAHVVIRERCRLGDRVIIQPGAVIGSCGFGYTMAEGKHVKLNQLGSVQLEDDVEIGANTTVDRARFKVTKIRRGTKVDNLVQLAHGVVIGQHNIVVAQTGIAGSTETGDWTMIGGQVAIDGHLKIGPRVRIAARSGVTRSLATGTYSGAPAQPIQQFNRMTVMLRNIETYVKKIKELQQRVEALETQSSN